MIELLKRFSAVVLNEPHLKPVLPQEAMIICFQYDYNLLYLQISASHCKVYKSCHDQIDILIKGNSDSVNLIITGKERLRKLESRSEIKITGKFKDILVVETLFCLCEKRLSA
ncbi:hypothetical protein ACOI1C_19660 [Bacillus sp. DJP31]|uniref:hypothetical protein n=1 Tax=Bacillus sp. DJP31 TaxID=3409789 RepID=UPI003BB5A541